MGHLARLLEEAGVTTVVIAVDAFGTRLRAMRLPRVLLTAHPMGRPVGPPNEAGYQRNVIREALALLESATSGSTVANYAGSYQFSD